MNLAKQISFENFGFITKATPQGFHTVQISEDKRGAHVYIENTSLHCILLRKIILNTQGLY
jgi:hypothetical protein